MIQNLISGIVGAIVGAIILYFLLGIPGKVSDLSKSVSKLEGQFETLIALQGQVKTLEDRVESVEEELSLTAGASKKFGSGWVDLDEPVDVRRGDKLVLKIGGTARKIIVRLLPKGNSPDLPIGILPVVYDVPIGRNLTIALTEDHLGVSQISVHGGPKAWDKYSLGIDNGPATLESVHIKRR